VSRSLEAGIAVVAVEVLRWPMMTTGRRVRMGLSTASSAFAGFRIPREVITLAVRCYLRYGLSYRDAEELLAAQHRGRPRDDLPVGATHDRLRIAFAQLAVCI
jgi:hypothetical protein